MTSELVKLLRAGNILDSDAIEAKLEALCKLRSTLPEKISEQWLYDGIRHYQRNCEYDEPTDGDPLDRYDGTTVAKILNAIPYIKDETT